MNSCREMRPLPPAMTDLLLSQRRPASPLTPYGHAEPNYALLKTTSEDSEELHGLYTNPQQPGSDISLVRSNVRGGYLEILLAFLLAVLMACTNHIVFAHLDGEELGSHVSQFWVTVLKNVFPAAVAFLLFMGLKICLSQVALFVIQRNSYPLELVNLITSPPGLLKTLSILVKSSLRISMLGFALLTAVTQAVALTSLFVPGTLTVVSAPSRLETHAVPSIDFNAVTQSPYAVLYEVDSTNLDLVFIEPSQRLRQLVMQAALSNKALTWSPPVECGTACSYTFTYFAPALNCTQLSDGEIWPTGPNATDSRLPFPSGPNGSGQYFLYNSTSELRTLNLDVTYMGNFISTAQFLTDPNQWSPVGVHCSYVNATYEATTNFFNNRQISSTQVQEWRPFILSDHFTTAPVPEALETNKIIAYASIIQTFNEIFQGSVFLDGFGGFANTSDTQASYTPLFELGDYRQENGQQGIFTFSLSPILSGSNLSAGLQNLLGNVTLAFVTEQLATTYANVTVTPNNTVYQYISWKLGLIYGVVFALSLLVITFGLFCLHKNGVIAVFDLAQILEMTAESQRLHESAAQPEFGSTLVMGVSSSSADGMWRRVGLDVSAAG
ncbi:hypothetical protein D9757_012983 [Collybiopsis confluens]|uniref:Uncharacterized protein n=1 Tax=Collybiopsis confluens TaxID=2823264 RepID=A0A8H5LQD1_9AGAR|nr:hypothetical protein D9757_012983 [Collybiopsis confluens]